jgi:hypothetical protein
MMTKKNSFPVSTYFNFSGQNLLLEQTAVEFFKTLRTENPVTEAAS